MPRPSNTTERREQIVQGLMRVMARTGYERATVQAIADEAGLAPGLVHYHFESKQAVLLALVDHLAALVRARWERRLVAGCTARERLAAFVDAHVELGADADRSAVACWVALGAEAAHQPEVRELWAGVVAERMQALTALVEEALEAEARQRAEARGGEARQGAGSKASGSERCGSASARAATLLAAIEGAYQLGIAAPSAVPSGFAAGGLRALVDALIDDGADRSVAAGGSATARAPTPPRDDWAVWRD